MVKDFIKLAKTLVTEELSKSEIDLSDISMILGILLKPIFKERGLPSFPFNGENND
jgi:hypothetical protein